MNRERLLVIVPAFNEENSVGLVLQQLVKHEYRVLLVSDGSTDNTAQIGRAIGVEVLELPINLGVGGALRAGFKYACRKEFQAVVQVDADGQHPVEKIATLVDVANQEQLHMVIGSRFIGGLNQDDIGRGRWFAMRLLARSASRATKVPITDATSGFRLIAQPLLGQFSQKFADNYLADTYEALVSAGRAGYRVGEVPVSMHSRTAGTSTATSYSAIKYIVKGLGVSVLRLHPRLEGHLQDNAFTQVENK
jgi:glycosyltransferase involved in cell wall biosynthesis